MTLIPFVARGSKKSVNCRFIEKKMHLSVISRINTITLILLFALLCWVRYVPDILRTLSTLFIVTRDHMPRLLFYETFTLCRSDHLVSVRLPRSMAV